MPLQFKPLGPSARLLLGPGPSQISPRVLRAGAAPLLGYLDPEYLALMDDTQALLKQAFETNNERTMCVPGTGMAGMEAALINLLEPGDEALVGISGAFGERMADICTRCGAQVSRVEAEWGSILEPEQVAAALKKGRPKLVALVHAETSTGVLQPLEEIATLVHESGALLVVDCVTSLGGVQVAVDRRGIDLAYSATQKCLGAPPGLAPITLGPAALEVYRARKTTVQSFYLDLGQMWRYWGPERAYHQTGMITMIYSLREALLEVQEEGLEARFARHRLNQQALLAGLEAMGLEPLVTEAAWRLPSLTTVRIPEGVDDRATRGALLDKYGIEIGGGLGRLAGRIWRVGLMGYASKRANVVFFLAALAELLGNGSGGEALAAAAAVYGSD